MKRYPQALETEYLRVPCSLIVFLVLVFFLHGHNFRQALHFEKKGYATWEEAAVQVEHGDTVRRVAMFLLGAFGVVSLLYKRRNQLRINGLLGFTIIFFLLWAVYSIAWTDHIGLTSRRLIVLVMFWLAAIAIAARFSMQQIMLLAFFICGVFLLIGISAEFALGTFHPLQDSGRFAGLEIGYRFCGTSDPNWGARELGTLLISAVVLASSVRRYRHFFLTAAFVALLFLILTKTRTSFAASLLSLMAWWILVTTKRCKLIFVDGLVVIICLLYFILGDDLVSIAQNAMLLGRGDSITDSANISTLTGRIPLWNDLLSTYIGERPFVGYGYGAFWTPDRVRIIGHWSGSGVGNITALNGYIDLVLALGLIGATAYVSLLVLGITRSIAHNKCLRDSGYAFAYAMFLFHALEMFTGSMNFQASFPTFIIVSLLAKLGFVAVRQNNEDQQKRL